MRRALALALALAVGVGIGWRLPRPAPPRALPSTPATASIPDCKGDRAAMAALMGQLAACNAQLAGLDAGAPTPSMPPPEASPAPPGARATLADLPYVTGPHRERVIVRMRDGTVASHVREDFPVDSDEGTIIAQTIPGRSGFFALDAGPDDRPVSLGDLAGGDGTILIGRGPGAIRFPRHHREDAGGP